MDQNEGMSEIAASVAKALGLHDYGPDNPWGHMHKWGVNQAGVFYLSKDGSDVFSAHWQARCRDWLHDQGYAVMTHANEGRLITPMAGDVIYPGALRLHCPAAEFCARAIHELMKDRP